MVPSKSVPVVFYAIPMEVVEVSDLLGTAFVGLSYCRCVLLTLLAHRSFESREVCEQVIKDFNNTPVAKTEGEEHLIQIRFADTPEQKALKQQTTAARQYRSAEYESQTHGHNGFFPTARLNSMGSTGSVADAGFENYMNMNGYVIGGSC